MERREGVKKSEGAGGSWKRSEFAPCVFILEETDP